MTYSDACRPYTRGIAPLVKPVGVGRMPIFWRNWRPMFWVTCAEVDEIPRTVLMMAIGSPLTNALGIAGSVGSHAVSHFWPAWAGAAGARSQSPAAACGGRPGAGAVGALDADALFTWASWACADARSAVSRFSSPCWALNVCCACCSAATALSWLVWALTVAWSAFCLASRAADSRLTCSVRARCRSAMTLSLLAASVCPVAAVLTMSPGSDPVRYEPEGPLT